MIDYQSDSGFTLLELLVALSLLALLSLALSGNITLGTKVWKTSITRTKQMELSSSFDEAIAEQLSHIYPRPKAAPSSTGLVDFDGSNERIEFLAEYPMGSGRISRIIYRANSTGQPETLTRHELANALDHSDFKPINGIRTIRFEYYGLQKPDAVANWYGSWREMNGLPALIRIQTVYSNGKESRLIVAPLLSADASCSYDLITRKCRGGQ